jgi:hypothetical protein
MTGGLSNVVHLNPAARVRELTANWRVQPTHVMAARCEALRAMQANGIRLSREAHEAWLCMSAVLVVARACGRE